MPALVSMQTSRASTRRRNDDDGRCHRREQREGEEHAVFDGVGIAAADRRGGLQRQNIGGKDGLALERRHEVVRRAPDEAGGKKDGHRRLRALPQEEHDGEQSARDAEPRKDEIRLHLEEGGVVGDFHEKESCGHAQACDYGFRMGKGALEAHLEPTSPYDGEGKQTEGGKRAE